VITRPVVIREMAPIDPEKLLEMQQNLSRLMAHMNEAPLVAAAAAASGAAGPSSNECAAEVKCTRKKLTTSKDRGVVPPKDGYTRHWTKEEFGWSYIDWDNSEFQYPKTMYPLL